MTGRLKCPHLSEESMVSGLYPDQDSGQMLLDENHMYGTYVFSYSKES
jgi:hypothetical protein